MEVTIGYIAALLLSFLLLGAIIRDGIRAREEEKSRTLVPVENNNYRIARAPERRVWTVDVGQLPRDKAEQYVRDLMVKHKKV